MARFSDHLIRRALGLGAVLFLLLLALVAGSDAAAAAAATSAPRPTRWITVDLGTHRFGHLATPAATVASAARDRVGFEREGYGPWSFDVAADGTVWLLDEVNNRLLAWAPGRPYQPRALPLPYKGAEDFAVTAGGTIYVAYKPSLPDSYLLYALTRTGAVKWTAPLPPRTDPSEVFNTVLRIGPDAALYQVDPFGGAWRPLTTPTGRPLPLARQVAGRTDLQPLPGGLRLANTHPNGHELRLTLSDSRGRVVRAWRITSATELGALQATPVMVGSDLVVATDVSTTVGGARRHEFLVLRLSPDGHVAELALDAMRVAWGDTITPLRIGPGAAVYQLGSSPATGARITRYTLPPSLRHAAGHTATATPSPSAAPGLTTPTPAMKAPAADTTPPATTSGRTSGRDRLWWTLGSALAAAGVSSAGWLTYRHFHT